MTTATPLAEVPDDVEDDEIKPTTQLVPIREPVSDALNPRRLAHLLREAVNGDIESYLILAEELEERDLNYASLLFTRKAAVSGIRFGVAPVDDSDEELEIAEATEAMLNDLGRYDRTFDMMDAIGKGFSFVEILWEMRGGLLCPRGFEYWDPRHFKVDYETLSDFRIEDGSSDGRPLRPFKWLMHKPKLKSGVAIRGGLARPASIAYAFKKFTLRDLAVFLKTYGIPPRVGRHDDGANDSVRKELLKSVARLGSDAAAVIPKSASIEILDGTTGQGSDVYLGTTSYWDRAQAKLVVGQTSSSEGAAGDYKASAQHAGVRLTIARHDAVQIAETVSRDLVRTFIALNWGPRDRYPEVTLPIPNPEDLTKFAAAVGSFIDRGLEVSKAQVYEKLGLTKPRDGEEVLSPSVGDQSPPLTPTA